MKQISIASIIFSSLATIVILLLLVVVFSSDPLQSLAVFFTHAVASSESIALLFDKTSVILLCGLSFAISMKISAFNFGMEGQYVFGALIAVLSVQLWPSVSQPWSLILAAVISASLSSVIGLVISLMKRFFNLSEIITSLFIAIGLLAVISIYPTLKTSPQNSLDVNTTGLHPLSLGLIVSIICTLLTWILQKYHVIGHDLRLIQAGTTTAKTLGVPLTLTVILTTMASTACAGLAGSIAVFNALPVSTTLLSNSLCIIGISASLLSRGHPIALLFASILLSYFDIGLLAAIPQMNQTPELLGFMIGVFILIISIKSFGVKRG